MPVHVPLADLLPTLLGHLGQRLATSGLEHSGWVLQRLGEPPLEEDLGTAALGLYDGDIVYLRPRDELLPPVDFDDLIDGIATGIADRRDRWRPAHGKLLSFVLAGLMTLAGLAVIATLPAGVLAARVSGTAMVGLLVCAIGGARAFGDRGTATVLGGAALGYAALAGAALPVHGPLTWSQLTPAPSLFAAAVFVAVAAVAVRLGTARLAATYTGIAASSFLVAIAALFRMHSNLSTAGTAALLIPVILLVGYFTPTFAAKFVGLTLPALPTSPKEFQQELDPEPSATVLASAAAADRYVTALYAGLGFVLSVALAIVALDDKLMGSILVLIVVLLMLLHSRELVSAWQRVAMMAPAATGLGVLLGKMIATHNAGFRVEVVLTFIVVAVVECAAGHVLPNRRLIPHWGLAGDIAHWLAAIAVIPLALLVAGIYGRMHHLWT